MTSCSILIRLRRSGDKAAVKVQVHNFHKKLVEVY